MKKAREIEKKSETESNDACRSSARANREENPRSTVFTHDERRLGRQGAPPWAQEARASWPQVLGPFHHIGCVGGTVMRVRLHQRVLGIAASSRRLLGVAPWEQPFGGAVFFGSVALWHCGVAHLPTRFSFRFYTSGVQ
ncbi:formin-like protein (ISS) [Anopheles sinensis]|uniref:Formin-like protein (ISS) n=1 Tax=Anopheles sinensis TaxID=74873 RepID=A0A084VVH5_ANOSI|nr:formin-like protein (ISS) [Anopheles sinensis]